LVAVRGHLMFTQVLTAAALVCGAEPAANDKPSEPEVAALTGFPKRMGFLIQSLQNPLPVDRAIEGVPLKEVIDYLEDVASPPESKNDPSLRVKIIANDAAFKDLYGPKFRIEDAKIKVPRLTGAKLETALRIVCEQIQGSALVVRNDTIEITTFDKAFGRRRTDWDSPILVYHNVVKQPLSEVLDYLGARHERTIALDARLGEHAKTHITVRLLNVPFETAVETVSEMAGLRAVRKENTLYVTTLEHAKALIALGKAKSLPGDCEPLKKDERVPPKR
jgi:hypothetical protein